MASPVKQEVEEANTKISGTNTEKSGNHIYSTDQKTLISKYHPHKLLRFFFNSFNL